MKEEGEEEGEEGLGTNCSEGFSIGSDKQAGHQPILPITISIAFLKSSSS
jgi:hypothetical protein